MNQKNQHRINDRKDPLWKRLTAWILIGILFSGTAFCELVSAETVPTASVIDEKARCSITVVKYEDYSYAAGSEGADHSGAYRVHRPMAEVGYSLYRIADLKQVTLDGSEKEITLEYRSLLKTAEGSVLSIPSGLSTTKELSDWVLKIRETTDPKAQAANLDQLWIAHGRTNADGILVFSDLPVGVYMLYEEETPSNVLRTENQCVVVTLPTTAILDGNNAADQQDDEVSGDNMASDSSRTGRYWDYDLIVRPKNDRKELSVEKHIRVSSGGASIYDLNFTDDPSNDLLTDTEDYQIGDTITYWICADVPEKIGEMKYYFLEDRMNQGQTFINDTPSGNQLAAMEVWGEKIDGSIELIPRVSAAGIVNWRCTDPGAAQNESNAPADSQGRSQQITTDLMRTFDLYFNTQTLSTPENGSLHRTALYRKLYVRFHAVLNPQAIIGGNGNENDIALKLSHLTEPFGTVIPNEPGVPSEEEDIDTLNPQCIDTRVYTYEVSLLKKGEALDSMEGVEFQLRDSNGTPIRVSRDERGYYTDEASDEAGEAIRIGTDQRASIRGLESGVYELVETRSAEGYSLLKNPILLTIESQADYLPFTYQTDEQGEFFRIEEGKGYYVLREKENGKTTRLLLDLEEMQVGDYIRLSENETVYSYPSGGVPSDSDPAVLQRFTARFSDSESMHWKSNYGMNSEGVIELVVRNYRGLSIPSTGGTGSLPYVTGGALLLLLAAILGVGLARRNRKR